MKRRGLLACLAVFACVQAAAAQGLRQVGNDAFGMTIEEVHPGASGVRVKVLIENLTSSREVFLHHEANQLNAQDFFFLPAARKNRQRSPNTFVLQVVPAGTASADLFFPIEPGNNPGLLILGSNKPPFEQVAVALGPILRGRPAEEQAELPAGLLEPIAPTPAPRPRPAPVAARPPARVATPVPEPEEIVMTPAPPAPPPAPNAPAAAAPGRVPTVVRTPAGNGVIELTEAAPISGSGQNDGKMQLSEAPPVGRPAVQPARPTTQPARPAVAPPKTAAGAAKPGSIAANPGLAAKPAPAGARPSSSAAKPPGKPQADQFYTPPGAPPQTRWVPVDEEPAAARVPAPKPRFTTPAGAPPQTGWIPVDDPPQNPTAGDFPVSEPVAAPPPPPRPQPARPRPQPQPTPQPRPVVRAPAPAAQPAKPNQPAKPAKPKIVFLPNTPGDRVLQIYTTPHASLGERLVLRAGRKGHSGYGWARIRDEHPNVNGPDIAMAASYPHQVWSDGRTLLFLRWSEDQNGAVVLQVAGDLIVNAQWASYDELLYWLGPGRIYPRLMYQGAR